MSEAARDPLAELARWLPTALDDEALQELANRLRPFMNSPVKEARTHLYTAAEAAEEVGVNVETIRRAIRSGELDVAGRIGRSPRLSREAIDQWLNNTIASAPTARGRRRRRSQSIRPE